MPTPPSSNVNSELEQQGSVGEPAVQVRTPQIVVTASTKESKQFSLPILVSSLISIF